MNFLSNTIHSIKKISPAYWKQADLKAEQLPIVYHGSYDITFLGLEKLHPFDTTKYGRVIDFLVGGEVIDRDQLSYGRAVSWKFLHQYHTFEYLQSLKSSQKISEITEMEVLSKIPWPALHWKLINPMFFHVGGTLHATSLATKYGWAINVGGGFHHAFKEDGGGFCFFADISMAVHEFRKNCGKDKKVTIIDFDAHQGNGHGRDFLYDEGVYILDIYNKEIFPKDTLAKQAIDCKVEVKPETKSRGYLNQVRRSMESTFRDFEADLIIYNAGTDILVGDSLGKLEVDEAGIVERDQIVFEYAREREIPIVMLLSGGYQQSNAKVIAESIKNLFSQGLI